ncbi:MAG: hypothetical protein LBM05_00635 [Endomicrobium sp.]|jgi:hypothetical protein|nr:hypothetical protein [Endomicrobium sp.]
MIELKPILYSAHEPDNKHCVWIKPIEDNPSQLMLLIYGVEGWTPLNSDIDSKLSFQDIQVLANGIISQMERTDFAVGTTKKIFPITTTKAIFDENGTNLDILLNRSGIVNASIKYFNDGKIHALNLAEAILLIPNEEKTVGFNFIFWDNQKWNWYIYTDNDVNNFNDTSLWENIINSLSKYQYLTVDLIGEKDGENTEFTLPYTLAKDINGNFYTEYMQFLFNGQELELDNNLIQIRDDQTIILSDWVIPASKVFTMKLKAHFI